MCRQSECVCNGHRAVILVVLSLLIMVHVHMGCGSSTIGTSLCETIQTTIRITKEEFDSANQSLIRMCQGDIRVNKCDGKCQSQLQPSFNSPTGFLKKCICCKEQQLRKSEFTLNDCFDVNGNRLFGNMASMAITMQEPEACDCIAC